MKIVILCLSLAALGFAAGYFVFAVQRSGISSSYALNQEISPGEKQISSSAGGKRGNGSPLSRTKEGASAVEILEKLKAIRVPPGDKRTPAIRQIIHQLENLVDLGPAAVPVIRDFFAKFEDVDYSSEGLRDDDGEVSNDNAGDRPAPHDPAPSMRSLVPGARRAPRLEFTTPPSLRLGLVDVLKEIGGEGAEQVLSELLTRSGRAVEVAYAARALQEIAGDKYRETAVASVKELLANPPKIDRPTRFDENSKAYLYSVLDLYGDVSFASNAQSLLVTADGHIDRTTLNYVVANLKEQAVSALYQAYKDPRVTNISEKTSLAGQILSHTGISQQANDIFREMVADESVPAWLRSLSIHSLAGGRGPLASSMPTDAAQIQARIELLNSLPDLGDEQLTRARDEAIERLSNRLSTVSQAGENPRTFRNRRGTFPNGPTEAPVP